MTQKMMNKLTFQIFKALLLADVVVIALSIVFSNMTMLWSTQIGFVSASLVMLASMKSYQRMVDTRVEHGIVMMNDSQEIIDKLEDPYDLYSEDVEQVEEKPLEEVVKEERKKLKGNSRSLGETLKDTKAALSIYRLGAYVLLVLGFLYLNRHGLLQIIPYILALSVPMFVVVFVLLLNKENA